MSGFVCCLSLHVKHYLTNLFYFFIIKQARNEDKLHICIAKIYQLLDEQTDSNDCTRTEKYLAAASKNSYASFLHWQIKYENMVRILPYISQRTI